MRNCYKDCNKLGLCSAHPLDVIFFSHRKYHKHSSQTTMERAFLDVAIDLGHEMLLHASKPTGHGNEAYLEIQNDFFASRDAFKESLRSISITQVPKNLRGQFMKARSRMLTGVFRYNIRPDELKQLRRIIADIEECLIFGYSDDQDLLSPSSTTLAADLLESCFILECESSVLQGTGFLLNGVGLVTCEHVVGTDTLAFHPSKVTEKYKVELIDDDFDLDIAVCRFAEAIDWPHLDLARRTPALGDRIAVVGFPNYQYGDSGVVGPGTIIGTRNLVGMEHYLTDAHIVAGMSGGPVVMEGRGVVGLAVTGAERPSEVQNTEKHVVVPISALSELNIQRAVQR